MFAGGGHPEDIVGYLSVREHHIALALTLSRACLRNLAVLQAPMVFKLLAKLLVPDCNDRRRPLVVF